MTSVQEIRNKYRIGGISVFDLVLSMLGMGFLMMFLVWIRHRDFVLWPAFLAGVLITIPISLFFHVLFGVNTQLTYKFGLSPPPTSTPTFASST